MNNCKTTKEHEFSMSTLHSIRIENKETGQKGPLQYFCEFPLIKKLSFRLNFCIKNQILLWFVRTLISCFITRKQLSAHLSAFLTYCFNEWQLWSCPKLKFLGDSVWRSKGATHKLSDKATRRDKNGNSSSGSSRHSSLHYSRTN